MKKKTTRLSKKKIVKELNDRISILSKNFAKLHDSRVRRLKRIIDERVKIVNKRLDKYLYKNHDKYKRPNSEKHSLLINKKSFWH